MDQLKEARLRINEIDETMAKLFEERMETVIAVIQYKMQNNLPILDNSRELEVIEKNLSYIKNENYKKYYREFIVHVMKLSKEYQAELQNH